ncbi:hypothetical protein [Acinetobacter johnsonii]|uniref:hypothetical protein n=1 Tax=Acinetobacter johnsonii TaxID=40214 RepID=UPI003F551B28
MKIIIGILAVIGTLVVLFFIALMIKNYKKIKRDTSGEFREFKDAPELMSFIRNVFECKKKHNVVMYGFVESISQDDILQANGLSDEPCLNIDAVLVTRDGHEKVNTTCGYMQADLKRGDFIAVIPLYNERHGFWYYVTIAKLSTVYLGRERGFSVKEQYVD